MKHLTIASPLLDASSTRPTRWLHEQLTPLLVVILLAGCGGGGGTPDAAMTSDAGRDMTDGPADTAADSAPSDTADARPADDVGGLRLFGGHRIAAAWTRSCAIRSGGKLTCWGGVDGEIKRPAVVEGLADEIASVYGGSDDRMCALTKAGALWCWADGAPPAAVAELSEGVRAVAMGNGYTCALRATGGVVCWGKNGSGQLGDGTQTDRAAPTAVVSLKDIVEIGAGVAHTCALTSGGAVSCWGDNSRWQLGDGTSIGRFAPVAVTGLGTDIDRLAVGPQHGCARAKDGKVSCWGFNASGQASSSGALFVPTATPFDAFGQILEVVAGGTYELGEFDHSLTCARAADGAVWCAGRGTNGELGDGVLDRDQTDIPIRLSALGTSLVDVAIGGQHVCAIDDRDQVWCWGRNYSGQLGRDTPASPVPVKMTAFGPFSTYDVGEDSTCARTSSAFYCWGANTGGQLGIRDAMALSPRFVPGAPADVKQWGTGALLTCWLRTTGQIHCMGGRVGPEPVEMTTLGADNAQLAVGNAHACVVKRDGTLWCWGATACSAVPETDPAPLTQFGSNNIGLAAGVNRTCVQRTDGSIWCCGDGWGMSPLQSPVGNDVVEMVLANDGCVRKASGAILCGPDLRQVAPVSIDGVAQLALAHDATCARKTDGSVWCWGKNTRGALGTGAGDAVTPTRVGGAMSFVDVSGGGRHFCALDAAGRLHCWGDNYFGQLGDGLGGDRALPGLVQFP